MQGKDVNIIGGKYAGLAGNVEEEKENGMVLIRIAGVINNQPIDKKVWLKKSQLEGGQHG